MAYIIDLKQTPKAPPTGSFLYYCYRKLGVNTLSDIMTLENFQFQVMNTAERYAEAAISAQKLQWWQTEIDQIYSNSPSHPIAKSLLPLTDKYQIEGQTLNQFIQQNQTLLFGQDFENHQALIDFIDQTYLPIEMIKAKICLDQKTLDEKTIAVLAHLTRSNEIIRRIHQLPHHLQRDIHSIPLSDITIIATEDYKQSIEQQTNTACQSLVQLAKKEADIARTLPQPLSIEKLKPFLIKNNLSLCLLKKLQKNNFPVFQTATALSPIKMLLNSL